MFKKIKKFVKKTVKAVFVKPFRKITGVAKNAFSTIKRGYQIKQSYVLANAHRVLDGTAAEAYVDTGVKILIAVVIGALLLAGLYALFGDTIMPTVTEKVEELFNYAG